MTTLVATNTNNPELFTADEVAAELRCCIRSVRYMLSRRLLKKVHMGRKVFVHRSEVARLVRNGVPAIRVQKAVR